MTRISDFNIYPRPLQWIGASRSEIRAFPDAARHEAGVELRRLQRGRLPRDWKPMQGVGPGACELRVRVAEAGVTQHRVVYVAKFPEVVYVLHAFEKKSRATPHHRVQVARARYRTMLRDRDADGP